jgi:squalene synthase HpnC
MMTMVAEVDAGNLRSKALRENFPVALRVLPSDVRTHLQRLYAVARVIDDLGDAATGDRTAALLAFRKDMSAIWHGGTPGAVVLRDLVRTVSACALPEQPFLDLIEANLRDQTTPVMSTMDDLLDYCTLSANPVGLLVLHVFGVATPDRVVLSDRVCTALQIIEHCQDVGEDHRAGRCYLPLSDLDQFGVRRDDLGAGTTSPSLRMLVEFEAARAHTLLASGSALLTHLRGWARLAVAGYVAGGLAALDALRRSGWSVLPAPPPRRRSDVLRHLTVLWLRAAW